MLIEAAQLHASRGLSTLEKQGLIQCFEYTHELAWKTLKDFLEERGVLEIIGSKDVVRASFQANLIVDGQEWMHMIQSRNLSSHSYDEQTVNAIIKKVIDVYLPLFQELQVTLKKYKEKEPNEWIDS